MRREVLAGTLAADGLALDPATLASLGGLVEADGPDRLRFRTSLVRDAAYDGLAYRVRARVHRTAGEVLERLSTDLDTDSPALVLHFARAGDAPRTWDYAQRAGRLARASYANADAADHLETALDVSRRLPDVTDAERAALWASVGDLRELAGMFTESVEAYRAAARLTRADPVATAEVLSRQAAAHLRTGAFTTTLRVVGRARRLIDGSDAPTARRTRVRLDALTAVVRVEQERPREAREWATRAMEAAGAVGEHETHVRALMLVDMVELQLGVPGLGARHREALEICVRHGLRSQEAKVRSNLGAMAYYAGRWTEAAQWYRSSRDVAMEAGSAFVAAQTDVNLGELLINQGHLDEARRGARERRAGAAGLGRRDLPGRGPDAAGAGAPQPRRPRPRPSGGPPRWWPAFAALEQPRRARWRRRWCGRRRCSARAGRPRHSRIIDGAERAAGADAAFSMPRMCLQRARALLALDRLEEAAEQVALGLVAAREQELPYEEALLLRVGQRHRPASRARRRMPRTRRARSDGAAGEPRAPWASPTAAVTGPSPLHPARRRRRRRGRAPTPGRGRPRRPWPCGR